MESTAHLHGPRRLIINGVADADVVPPAPENDMQTNKVIKVRLSEKRIQGMPWRSSSRKLVLPHQLQNMISRTEADLKSGGGTDGCTRPSSRTTMLIACSKDQAFVANEQFYGLR